MTFDKILAPVSITDFFTDYFEKEMLLIRRNDGSYFQDILTFQELSGYLERMDNFYPSIRMVKDGKELSAETYTLKGVPIGHHKKDGIVDPEKIFDLFRAGSSFVIQAGQRYFENLSATCFNISTHFRSPVQANIYITPNGSRGFNPHWDTHDVFVLQISGTKTWHLYGMEMDLPVKGQSLAVNKFHKKPVQTIQLHPGDMLYLPRGYVHDAVADDGISSHITIGALAYTWKRLFIEMMTGLDEHKSFREAIPFWKNDVQTEVTKKVEEFAAYVKNIKSDKFLAKLNDAYAATQPVAYKNYFAGLVELDKLSLDSVVGVNKNIATHVLSENDKLVINFRNKRITMPAFVQPAIDILINSSGPVSLSSLRPVLNEASILVLAKKLIAEGFLYLEKI